MQLLDRVNKCGPLRQLWDHETVVIWQQSLRNSCEPKIPYKRYGLDKTKSHKIPQGNEGTYFSHIIPQCSASGGDQEIYAVIRSGAAALQLIPLERKSWMRIAQYPLDRKPWTRIVRYPATVRQSRQYIWMREARIASRCRGTLDCCRLL